METKLKVLIVEKDEATRMKLAEFYDDTKAIVTFVDGSYFALKLLSMNHFDEVVTNLDLATISDFYLQVKSISKARLLCSSELGVTGTPTGSEGLHIERQELRLVN